MGENVRGNSSSNLLVHFVGGGLAGITAASATYPLDLVRTRLAAQVTSLTFCSLHEWLGHILSCAYCLIDLNPIRNYFLFTLILYIEIYILFLCREVPCTTEASHMLSVPSVEMKVSWVCIRGLELHCWYAHNVLLTQFLSCCVLIIDITNHFLRCRVLGLV